MQSPAKAGDILAGKYRVENVLGVGGMGIVVSAVHLQLGQLVALKFMRSDVLGNKEAVERFLREARAVVRLKSHHVARITDVGTLDSGSPYIVMEYLEGLDLAATIAKHRRLPPDISADVILQACHALSEAHSLGIVHRDLKPANLFMTKLPGGSTMVKVLDFGISKAISSAGADLTRTASILGSPRYMSPEQMRASKQVDARADIWSLGVILYEAVSGLPPFEGEVFTEVCLKVMMDPVPPLSERLPPAFSAVVMRCLEKDPGARFKDVADLAEALGPFASPACRPLAKQIRDILGGKPPPTKIAPITLQEPPSPVAGTNLAPVPPTPAAAAIATPVEAPAAKPVPVPPPPRRQPALVVPNPASEPAFTSGGGQLVPAQLMDAQRRARQPEKVKSRTGLIAFLVILLLGAGAAGAWYFTRASSTAPAPTVPASVTPLPSPSPAPAPAPAPPPKPPARAPVPSPAVAPPHIEIEVTPDAGVTAAKPQPAPRRRPANKPRPEPDSLYDYEDEPEQTAPSLVLPERTEVVPAETP